MENNTQPTCGENCDKKRCISTFEHENALWHYGRVNKRSMTMMIANCVTVIIIILTFVIAYTIREQDWTAREKYLVDMIVKLSAPAAEVRNEEGLP